METILLSISFVGLILLILTPWVKSGTLLAIGSLIGYFYFSGVDGWIPILLIIIGLLLIVVEVFIPDFGVIGILGVGSIALGIYYTVGDFGLMVRDLSVALVTSAIVIFVLVRNGYSFTNFNKIVLNAISKEPAEVEESESETQLKVGMSGVAVTPLRPSGKAMFNGQTISYDVLSVEGHIEKDAKVIVHETHGSKITVRREQ